MAKQREKHPFEDNPFVDDFLEWMESDEGQDSIEALDIVWPLLEKTGLDAKRQKIIWPGGVRLSIAESVQHILKDHPDISPDLIETKIIDWLETISPSTYSQEQLDELDQLTERWIIDHKRQAEAARKSGRTRHS